MTPHPLLMPRGEFAALIFDCDGTLVRSAAPYAWQQTVRRWGPQSQMPQAGIPRVSEITEVADVARAHYGQVPLAVASSGGKSTVRSWLAAVGLFDLFDAIVTADDVSHSKPAPDIYLAAAERLAVVAEECVAYEDSDPGIAAARAAGMRVIDIRSVVHS